MTQPSMNLDSIPQMNDGCSITVGIDEAGRGPLAGPVSAGAVIIPPDFPLEILNDSKKLTEKKRLEAEKLIKEKCLWGLAFVEHDEIDKINILNASLLAMKLAYQNLIEKLPQWCREHGINQQKLKINAIIDGIYCPKIDSPCRAEPKADGKYPEVMAASIIAKTARDRLMIEVYDKKYPEYGYAKHKGYPTQEHKKICRQIGPSPIQRHTFKY